MDPLFHLRKNFPRRSHSRSICLDNESRKWSQQFNDSHASAKWLGVEKLDWLLMVLVWCLPGWIRVYWCQLAWCKAFQCHKLWHLGPNRRVALWHWLCCHACQDANGTLQRHERCFVRLTWLRILRRNTNYRHQQYRWATVRVPRGYNSMLYKSIGCW